MGVPAVEGGSVVLAVAGKHLVFEPEAIGATIAHLEGVLDQIGIVQRIQATQFAGDPAALDFASADAVQNLLMSADRLQVRMAEAVIQVQAAIDNLRANGSAYTRSDVVPGSAGAIA